MRWNLHPWCGGQIKASNLWRVFFPNFFVSLEKDFAISVGVLIVNSSDECGSSKIYVGEKTQKFPCVTTPAPAHPKPIMHLDFSNKPWGLKVVRHWQLFTFLKNKMHAENVLSSLWLFNAKLFKVIYKHINSLTVLNLILEKRTEHFYLKRELLENLHRKETCLSVCFP